MSEATSTTSTTVDLEARIKDEIEFLTPQREQHFTLYNKLDGAIQAMEQLLQAQLDEQKKPEQKDAISAEEVQNLLGVKFAKEDMDALDKEAGNG